MRSACAAARDHLTGFARVRAWRREPSQESIDKLLILYQQGRDAGLCYEAAMKHSSIVGVLVSPYFLYREQSFRGSRRHRTIWLLAHLGGAPGLRPLGLLIPDAELLGGAANGSLQHADALRARRSRA